MSGKAGEPDEVVAEYERQLDAWRNFRDGDEPTTQVFRGHETLHDSRYASGGGDLTMNVVCTATRSQPTFAFPAATTDPKG